MDKCSRVKQSSFEKLLKGKDNNIIKTLNDKKRRPKVSVKEYDPANKAGTTLSEKCTLIVWKDYLQKHMQLLV